VDPAPRPVIVSGLRETDVTRDLSPAEAAKRTGLSRTLIYREIGRGHLRAYKVGGHLRIAAEALADWKRVHAVVPRPQPAAYDSGRAARARGSADSFGAELRAMREEGAA
jgi:excisionase family DNA binding protein